VITVATTTAKLALPLKLTATDAIDKYLQSLGYRDITITRAREINGWVSVTVTSRWAPAQQAVQALRDRFL
jgi:hypothetical protein